MEGIGTQITCHNCHKSYTLDIYGQLKAASGKTEFSHIPDWYAWERQCVKEELEKGKYLLDIPVEIAILKDFRAIYKVGEGRLVHSSEGFKLTGCNGRLEYTQSPTASYGLYADYFWYEIADVICIGDKKQLYYCFPKQKTNVAKARLAAEELYNNYATKK